ncbi:MAG TPA: OmpA family protein [Candidatus Binataceae bacterium]|nr:OmpA family protein [Candidatus Binataceae bacterium]
MRITNLKSSGIMVVTALAFCVWCQIASAQTVSGGSGEQISLAGSSTVPALPPAAAGHLEMDAQSGTVGQKHTLERVVFSEMMFAKDSDQLSDVGVGRCYLVSQKLKHGNDVRVVVQGRSGSEVSSTRNEKLCLGRAEAIRKELKKFGISESRMSAVRFGDASASFKADWARGGRERAEFEIEAEETGRQFQ